MAVDKGKVKAALDAKLKGTSVTKELKEQLAELYAGLIEDEAGVEDFINTRETEIKIYQKEADRRSQAAAEKARKDAADAVAGKTEPDPEPTLQDDPTMPAWAKQMLADNKALRDQLNGFQQAQQQKTIAERFTTDPRLKGVHPSFLKNRTPADEAGFDAAVDEVVNDWKAIAESHKFAAFGNETPAGGATPTDAGKGKPADEADVKRIASLVG